jgi:lysyl-tRNA synthetase class 2
MSDAPRSKSAISAGWQPSATLEMLQQRTRLIAHIRQFFALRNVLEVETPILAQSATPDPALVSFQTEYSGPGFPDRSLFYLHTSPEFFMKRLLAANSASIYQFARVFRNNESGRRHNPEFTLLEWYRVGFSYHELMDEIESLLRDCCVQLLPEPARRISYRQLFIDFAAVDPFAADMQALKKCLLDRGHEVSVGVNEERQIWLDLVLTHVIEPQLQNGAFFVFDYPADQAALAQIRYDEPPVAERFELYINGVELANGFQELTDAAEQRIRFEEENRRRVEYGLEPVKLDELFLHALEAGLPRCAGVALGVERLLMQATGAQTIDQVMAFPVSRV